MVGQGSPKTSPGPIALYLGLRLRSLIRLAPVTLLLCATLAGADEPTMRLRIAWGSNSDTSARKWQGSIALSEGRISNPRPLGMEADEPGSFQFDDDQLLVRQPQKRNYDGVDIDIDADLSAVLKIELAPADDLLASKTIDIPLERLVRGYGDAELDDRGNKLLVRRSPGDELRIKLSRDSLVFTPGESFAFELQPHLLGIAADTTVTIKAKLFQGRGSKSVTELLSKSVAVAAESDIEPIDVEFNVPQQEGVYEIGVDVVERRLRNPFALARPTIRRKIQLVVVNPQPPVDLGLATKFELVGEEIDPTREPSRARLPIPGFGSKRLDNEKSSTISHAGQPYLQLKKDGWQAYPLEVSTPGMPHILEIDYPGDLPQTLGISIVEPNAEGAVIPIGLDSGVEVSAELANESTGVSRHRLIFWPRTEKPYVLMTNRGKETKAVFGRMRVLAGPNRLRRARPVRDTRDDRMIAAYYAKPLFPENFSATDFLDPGTHRALDDWQTFYQGTSRLVQYLSHIGYNSAVISALCEGSTIYPSELLEPTPKFDSGVFFANGQDPVRKDVLELAFRLFDREGMRLIPALQFAAPLPELEKKLRDGGPDSDGILLVDETGTSWVDQNGTRLGLAPYYNPLNDEVQDAMVRVAAELIERYADHPSFDGVMLQLSRDGYAQLAGADWGLDDRTVRGFQKETGVTVPGSGPDRFQQRSSFLKTNSEARVSWLKWRADRMASLYRRLQVKLSNSRKGAKLYLDASGLLDAQPVNEGLRPTLPVKTEEGIAVALIELGLDADRLRDEEDIVLMRPRRIAPVNSVVAQGSRIEFNNSPDIDRFFSDQRWPGTILYHPPRNKLLPEFDAKSPFGRDRTFTWLVSHITPAASMNRQRFAHGLATLDSLAMIDGGWMLPMGQEESIKPLVDVFHRLPARPFETVESSVSTQPVVVRRLSFEGKTYVYLVNNSPWDVAIELQVEADADVRIESLRGTRNVTPLERLGLETKWKVQLKPYDLVAARLTSPNVELRPIKVTIPDGVADELRRRIRDISARIDQLRNPPNLDVVSNPGFEAPADESPLPGWVYSSGENVKINVDRTQARTGSSSTQMESTGGVAWLRSKPFTPPKTGRMSVWVWLRVDSPDVQPPLRLALEAKHKGKTYYRFANVGGGGVPVSTRWSQFIFQVDDLPTSELTEMRVGFDLMGPGKVWVDDVQPFDLSFTRGEQQELAKLVALANFSLNSGKVIDCNRVLDSYWPRFLTENVELPQANVAARPRPRRERITAPIPRPQPTPSEELPAPAPDPSAEPEPPSTMERVKGWLKWRPF